MKKTNVERFEAIIGEMRDLFAKKNKDYGNSFDIAMDEDGLVASKIRLGDKYRRFSQLITWKREVNDESMRDTLIDMANYAIMTIMWMDLQDKNSVEVDNDDTVTFHDPVEHLRHEINKKKVMDIINNWYTKSSGADFDGDIVRDDSGNPIAYVNIDKGEFRMFEDGVNDGWVKSND